MDLENRKLEHRGQARALEAVMTDGVLSPPACQRLRELLARSLDRAQRAADPENQVDGFLGAGLPEGSRLWSKAGWMSKARHDAGWWRAPDGSPALLVAFSDGAACAKDEQLLPELARQLAPSGSEAGAIRRSSVCPCAAPTGCLDRASPGDRHNCLDKVGLKGKGWFSHPLSLSAQSFLPNLHW